jgi:hypothetical protein
MKKTRETPRPTMSDEEMVNDYPRLSREYTLLHQDYREAIRKQLITQSVSNSYAVVRWHENKYEDVVCADKQVALEYIEKYNKLAANEKCYLDQEIWLPLTKA